MHYTPLRITLRATAVAGLLLTGLLVAFLPAPTLALIEPTIPQNIQVRTTGPQRAVVNWDAVDGAESYTVEVFTRAGTQTAIYQRIEETTKTIGSQALRLNKAYYVRVKAVNAFGSSGLSEAVDFRMPPGKVKEVRVVAQQKQSTTFEWDKPRGDIAYYLVQVKRGGKVRRTIRKTSELDATDPRFTLKKLKRSRSYRVRIRAVGEEDSKGPYSDSVLLGSRRDLF